jgi:hypothetical protein
MTLRSSEFTLGVSRAPFIHFRGGAIFRLSLLAGAAFLLATAPCRTLFGGSINYGDFDGDHVKFLQVTESSDKPLPLYGAPEVSGDSLSFNPQQFAARSDFAVPPNDTTDGQLTFNVMADQGQAVTKLSFEEGGALSVTGLSSATDDTYVDVSALGFITVTAIDGVGVNPIPIPIDLTFNFGVGGDGTWRRASEGSVNGFLWDGGQDFDLTQVLKDLGENVKVGATKLKINLDNILYAQSEPVGAARIDKKLFLHITTERPEGEIPEPCCLALVGIGAIGVVMSARRRSW